MKTKLKSKWMEVEKKWTEEKNVHRRHKVEGGNCRGGRVQMREVYIFFFFLNGLLCFWVEEKEKEEKRKEEIKYELKLNEGVFVISPPICPKCQLFYNQS